MSTGLKICWRSDMRISDHEKRNMQDKILNDLYSAAQDALTLRKQAVAKKNRELYLAPYLPILDQLPVELIPHHNSYKVQVSYRRDPNTSAYAINDRWEYKADKPLINPHSPLGGGSYYSGAAVAVGKLNPQLYEETAAVCEDQLALTKEREELETFLRDTLRQWSGPKQLQKVWPESLHSYLPTPKPRAPRKKKEVAPAPEPIAAPAALSTRLTTNLLESN